MAPAPPPLPKAASSASGQQRRQHQRFEVQMSAEIRTATASFTANTSDISEGGVGVESSRPLHDGEELAIALFLVIDGVEDEKTPPLWVKGRVAWSAEADDGRHVAGIKFEVITDEQKAWLSKILEHIKQESS